VRRVFRWLSVLLTLAVVAAAGVVGYGLGWFDSVLGDSDADPAAVAEPWQSPAPSPSAVALSTATPDAAKVRAALRGLLSADDLGAHVVGEVASVTGVPLITMGSGAATPASTTKVLTAAAALHVYGAEATFSTTLLSSAPATATGIGRLVLVGGGDPLLSSKPVKDELLPRADVTTLAKAAAVRLKAAGSTRVRLSYDDSLFEGPATSPTWPASYVSEDVVSPVGALRVDEGRLKDGRDLTPALTASRKVAAVLRSQGIAVAKAIKPAAAGSAAGEEIARVSSAPLRDLVQHTLETSDNDAAETLAHLVGAKAGAGSFAGGAAATRTALTELGVPLEAVTLYDGSGLSRKDWITPAALTSVLSRATTDPDLQSLVYGLPVAGFSGSLLERFTDSGAEAGLGLVRAKTGTLTGVSALAGFVADADGTPMIYVVMADQVPVAKMLAARGALDDAAAALAACHCSTGVPASPSDAPTPPSP